MHGRHWINICWIKLKTSGEIPLNSSLVVKSGKFLCEQQTGVCHSVLSNMILFLQKNTVGFVWFHWQIQRMGWPSVFYSSWGKNKKSGLWAESKKKRVDKRKDFFFHCPCYITLTGFSRNSAILFPRVFIKRKVFFDGGDGHSFSGWPLWADSSSVVFSSGVFPSYSPDLCFCVLILIIREICLFKNIWDFRNV